MLRVTYDDGSTETLVRNGQVQGNLSEKRIVMATNDFLLTGGDGYRVLQAASEERGAQRTQIGEQQVLVEYIQNALGSSCLPGIHTLPCAHGKLTLPNGTKSLRSPNSC